MIPIGQMPVPSIPRNQLVNSMELMGYLPRTIGPMVTSPDSGGAMMLTIGAPSINPIIDPIQIFVNSAIPVDMTGIMTTPAMPILSQPDQGLNENTDIQVDYMLGFPLPAIPRTEIINSGSLKNFTCPVLPISMNRHLQLFDFIADDARFIIKGQTLDGANNPLAGCTVVAFITAKLVYNPDGYTSPVEVTTVSDSGGNYSMVMHGAGPYEVTAYLAGSTDVAGITVNSITPVVG
jgi:hypothetical protein